MALSRSTGKSTFTRWTSRPGRRAFDQSTYGVMSTPASASRSNSSAVTHFALAFKVSGFFVCACAPDRDDADRFFMAICHRRGPDRFADLTHKLKTRFVG